MSLRFATRTVMSNHYAALIIGSGQGGTPLAQAFANAGKRTALVEATHIGGTCINEGCTPTKTMIASGRSAYMFGGAKDLGIDFNKTSLNLSMEAIRQRKRDIVDSFRGGSERRVKNTANLDFLFGKAKFLSSSEVEVTSTEDSSKRTITADTIFINAGCAPAQLNVKGVGDIDPANLLNSTSIMEVSSVPEHLLVIGGGPIGLEFAQLFRRLGSRVSIIQHSKHLIPIEDVDISSEMEKIFTEDGIDLYLGAKAQAFSKTSSGSIMLEIQTAEGKSKSITASHVLNATGRPPNTSDLNLSAAGVSTDARGFITVTPKLETTAANIYALGDIKGGPAFTHISYDDYRILKHNLLSHTDNNITPLSIENRLVPYCVFTDPQLGRIGLSETQARKVSSSVAVASQPMTWVARALEINETRGMMKAVVDTKTEKILGFACLGYEGGEVMSTVQMAIQGGLTWRQVRDTTFAHPCTAEALNNLFGQFGDD